VHWNGQTWRLLPPDFNIASHYRERYGADFVPADLSIQDWGVTYDELEPHFDRFERLCGIGGRAGNLRGTRQPGGNPFEGWRSREFPNPPSDPAYAGALFGNATAQLGYTPFQVPTANMTRAYTNPEGLQPQPCSVCGFCERFGCEHYAKASPETVLLPRVMAYRDFELRTHAHVTKITIGGTPRMATGVVYVDGAGAEIEQPASLVLLCAYGLNNGQLLLNSGIGTPYDPATRSGTIGRNYAYQTIAAVAVFYRDDVRINPFMGAWALGTAIDDFNGDNFDHSDVGFVGGAYVAAFTTGGRPIEHHPVPPGTPRWGSAWKGSVKRHYNHTVGLTVHGSSMSTPHNYLSRDPTYRDKYGQPSLRITFDFPDNDVRMANFVLERTVEIARLMGGDVVAPASRTTPYSVVPYRTTHNTGGAVMGVDPTRSAVNRYLQS
jgi:gluconate 2-dehydrogenase alpha chain